MASDDAEETLLYVCKNKLDDDWWLDIQLFETTHIYDTSNSI